MKRMNGSAEVIFGIILIFVVLFFLAVIGFAFARAGIVPIHSVYSEGERTGVVYKLSKKGMFCKTWEGEMNLGGTATNGDGQAVPNAWYFSVVDDAVARHINEYAGAGKRVTLMYVEYFSAGICEGHTNYVITAVR